MFYLIFSTKNSNMYGIVLPTLLLVCSGIVNSKPTINVSEGVTETGLAIVATDSSTSTTIRPSIGLKNCSHEYLESVQRQYSECISNKEWSDQWSNPTSDGPLIFKEYCNKIPFEECLNNATSKLSECIKDENNQANITEKFIFCEGTNSYQSFWCQDEGSRMTTFYAERAPFCVSEKTRDIHKCIFSHRHNNTCQLENVKWQCYRKALQECQLSQTVIHLADLSFEDVLKVLPNCTKLRLD